MGDNMTHSQQEMPEYGEPSRPSIEDLFRALAEGQRLNQDTMNDLAQAVFTLVEVQPRTSPAYAFISGPKVKKLKTYDGDRSNGKFDDHIQDVSN
jgi:hypothetical protein